MDMESKYKSTKFWLTQAEGYIDSHEMDFSLYSMGNYFDMHWGSPNSNSNSNSPKKQICILLEGQRSRWSENPYKTWKTCVDTPLHGMKDIKFGYKWNRERSRHTGEARCLVSSYGLFWCLMSHVPDLWFSPQHVWGRKNWRHSSWSSVKTNQKKQRPQWMKPPERMGKTHQMQQATDGTVIQILRYANVDFEHWRCRIRLQVLRPVSHLRFSQLGIFNLSPFAWLSSTRNRQTWRKW